MLIGDMRKNREKTMLLSAYTLSYGNWTVIPDHWKMTFDDIAANGFDAVDLTFSESEARYAMRTFEMQIRLAHQAGLKVFAIPSRIGGRFAGAPLMPCLWLANHPGSGVPEDPAIACLENPEYREWSLHFVENLVSSFEIDGIIWDEPKAVSLVSTHPDTLAKYGPSPTPENMMDSFLEYLTELTAAARRIRPELSVTVFNMPGTDRRFTARCPLIPGIDFCGFDASISRMSYFHEEPREVKPRARQMWKRTVGENPGGSSCGTFVLIENILMPESVHEEYEEELERTMSEIAPDHLSCYYYGHNNEAPAEVQQITMRAIGKFRRRAV